MECTHCHKPTPTGITLCHDDVTKLEYCLAEIDGVWDEMQHKLGGNTTSQTRIGGGQAATSRPPLNLSLHDHGLTLHERLAGWGSLIPEMNPTGEPPAIAAQFLHHTRTVRTQDWAGDFYRELDDILHKCRTAIYGTEERVLAGICPEDQTPVYARKGTPEARCPTCGNTWDVTGWREKAAVTAGFTCGTAAELSRILTDPLTDEALPASTIRAWANRKKITPTGTDTQGRPVYELSKVRDLMDTRADKKRRHSVSA